MERKQIIIGLDNGNKFTKTSSGTFLEESSVKKVEDDYLGLGKKIIRYEDNFYIIGEGRGSVKLNKFEDEDTFIISSAAIANELEHIGTTGVVDITLGVGLPLMSFGRYKHIMKEYFLRDNIKVYYNKREYNFNIKEVYVFPQGMAAFTSIINNYKEFDVSNVLDLGGYTLDTFQTGENGIPIISTLKSYPIGIITLIEEIKQELLRKEIKLNDRQIEKIIKEEDLFIFDNLAVEIIKDKTNIYVKELINKLKESGMELKNPTILIGGGFNLIERYIREYNEFSYIEFMDIYANSRGYRKLIMEQKRKYEV